MLESAQNGYKEMVVQALKVGVEAGTAITTLLGVQKAVSDWTAKGRLRRKELRITELTALSRELELIPSSGEDKVAKVQAADKARDQLRIALERYVEPTPPTSNWRRAFLLYAPSSVSGWIAHFLFHCLGSIGIYGLFSQLSDNSFEDDWRASVGIFIVIGILMFFFHCWAVIARRQKSESWLEPTQAFMGVRWYRANSLLGLMANSMCVWGLGNFIAYGFLRNGSGSAPPSIPLWEWYTAMLIQASFIPMGHFWARTEYLFTVGKTWQPKMHALGRMTRRGISFESKLGIFILVFLVIWFAITLVNFRLVSIFSRYPSEKLSQVGIEGAIPFFLAFAFINGFLPCLAVFRGLQNLLSFSNHEVNYGSRINSND